ncbi:MAG: cell division protein ZapA [Candidatus Marinimicrobia bacterium]|nr:cell division protein ZapA [Candidatus Neomarinimicrobiota bacterium]
MNSNHVVKVNIGGQEYSLRTSADASYIRSVADYINERMKEIDASSPGGFSQMRSLVLSTMNITDELFTERKKKEKLLNRIESKIIAIREYIDDRLSISA